MADPILLRPLAPADREELLDMMGVFYASPAVITPVTDEILRQDIEDCLGECPFVEGWVFDAGTSLAGYAMLAKSYSTERGGLCLWVEDLYLREEYRHQGLGKRFFALLEERYASSFRRFRLEAEEENLPAVAAYRRAGFHALPYLQMVRELE